MSAIQIDPHSAQAESMPDTGKSAVRALLDILSEHGVNDIVCSPGSRNAPLLMAAAAREPLRKHVVIDERTAGFMALGLALVSRKPVALVCTSGTALLNYAPAVAEAFHQGVPLIVVSADRPIEWIDQDDSQTIRQFEALRNIVKASYDISDREGADRQGWFENRTFNDAMLVALDRKQGPVHINLRLSPPLDTRLEEDDHNEPHPGFGNRVIRRICADAMLGKEDIRELAERLVGKKVMLVAGFMLPEARMNRNVGRFREHPNVCVMAETLSNLHLPATDFAIDSLFADSAPAEGMQPDVVISVGGALVSRMLKEYLRKCSRINPEMEHWSVGYQPTTVDCFQALTLRIEADPARFIGQLSAEMARIRNRNNAGNGPVLSEEIARRIADSELYADTWRLRKIRGMERIDHFADESPWSELTALRMLFTSVPENWNLFLSNGTIVRYAQLLLRRQPHANYCNRGVSGIEGSTSTALGGALCSVHPTLLVSGDMSFAHDLGALLAASRCKQPLKIIVVNNAGGGIFRFVSSTCRLDCRNDYLCADPQMDVKAVSQAFGFSYLKAEDEASLADSLKELYADPSLPQILEIFTPAEKSAMLLRDLLTQK